MVLSHRRSISKNAICWLSGSTKSAFYILVAKNDKNYHKRTNLFINIFIVLEIRAIKAESGKRKAESGEQKAESGKRKAESGKREAGSG